jgi:hypothetical protein
MADAADRTLRAFDTVVRTLVYAGIAAAGVIVAIVASDGSNLELAGKITVMMAAFLYLLPLVSRSRS